VRCAHAADANDSVQRHPARYGQNGCAIAVGRRNWTFCGSDAGGHRAAVMYTLIESAKLADADPKAWLADVLARIADHPAQQIDALLPWSWKAARERQAAHQAV
jgi:transposase